MARADSETLLSLDRYAAIMGIPPAQFNTGAGVSLDPAVFPLKGNCTQVWWQYAWQTSDRVSRDDLAREIQQAEEDIANFIGYYPAPKWIAQEVIQNETFHRPDWWNISGTDSRGAMMQTRLKYAKLISGGRRGSTLIEASEGVVYSDEDSDGLSETATVAVNTTVTDACEIKFYFAGKDGDPAWEIRPARTKVLAGGVCTATFWSWQLIIPELWEALPTSDGETVIDISTTNNFVRVVDVYREYNDTTAASAELYWEKQWQPLPVVSCAICGGAGCASCTLTYQEGCLRVSNPQAGLGVVMPATYDNVNDVWNVTQYSECRAPDIVKVWYYAGDQSQPFLSGRNCDPLSDEWARIIAYIATARLERPFCACGNATALAEKLRVDLALSNREVGSRFLVRDVAGNPFGTHYGEVIAYQRISKLIGRKVGVAVF